MNISKYLAIYLALCSSIQLAQVDTLKSAVVKDKRIKISNFPLAFYNFSYTIVNNFFLVKQANEGIPAAQLELGLRYLEGKGFPNDSIAAIYWITKSAESGFPYGKYNLAVLQYYGIANLWSPFEAYENFLYAAKRDLPDACFALGTIFLEGLLVNQNLEFAHYWLKKSSDLNFDLASKLLKKISESGFKLPKLDLKKNYEELSSLNNFTKYNSDQYEKEFKPLIIDFENIDINFEDKKEEMFLKEAAITLNVVKNIEELDKKIKSDNIVNDNDILLSLFSAARNSIEYYVPEAFLSLGIFYQKGLYVKKDLKKAFENFLLAYRCGYNKALIAISNLVSSDEFKKLFDRELKQQSSFSKLAYSSLMNLNFYQGNLLKNNSNELLLSIIDEFQALPAFELGSHLITKNSTEAEKYLYYASQKGNLEALLKLYLIDLLNKKNADLFLPFEKIEEYYRKGNATAGLILAYCYENGIFVENNFGQAIKIYRSLSSRGIMAAVNSLERLYSNERKKYYN